ncbi:MAG TPA: DUF6152 family protein [Gammaproteobacteria bacterium]
MKNSLLALLLAVALHPTGLRAHHSFASEFDANQPVSLKGTVTKVEFINPHSWIHIEVTNADGTKAAWEVEGGTPNTLFRKGINDSTLPVGTPIVVDGYKARDGSNRMSGRNITLADGRQVFLSGSAPP